MPFVLLLRGLFSFLSLTVLVSGLAITWRWYEQNAYFTPDGKLQVLLADWPLWLGLLLLALSFLGRWLWVPIIARADDDRTTLHHVEGQRIRSSSGARLFVCNECLARDRPIIFVHGSSLDSSVWTHAREAFDDHQIIVFDLPGLGKSRKDGPVTLTKMAEDLQFVIERQATAPIVVGHSMGGMIIQTLARNRPDLFDGSRIAGVVLFNTSYTNPLKTMVLSRILTAAQPLIELFLRLQIWLLPLTWLSGWQSYLSGTAHIANRLTFGKTVTRSELKHVTLISTRNSPAVIAEGELAMLHWDATDALQNCLTPVLVVAGSADPVTMPSASEYISASSPTSNLVIVEGGNHMSFLDKREEYHSLLREFVTKVGARNS
jgi:pimeloyl-ACP methyl ester carboxylesterase